MRAHLAQLTALALDGLASTLMVLAIVLIGLGVILAFASIALHSEEG